MTNPTSNFGWQMPTSTDLVTDLPADFAVFGQAVDTSMADLKGGTTGQILSKATATDMDFTWITNDVGDITAVTAGTGISGGGTSGAVTITNSMATEITAKGDLIVGTGSATFDNLPVGSNSQILVADSSTSTGLKWATPAVASSGMTLITKASFSAVADTGTTFDNVFSSTYDNYFAVYNVSSSTTSGDFQLQLRYAGPTTQTTTYFWITNLIEGAGPSSTLSRNTSDSVIKVAEYCGSAAYALAGIINLQNILSTGSRPSFVTNAFGAEFQNQQLSSGNQDTSRAYTGLLFKASAGNITGTVSIYGLAK
jgi:hypothetical protein